MARLCHALAGAAATATALVLAGAASAAAPAVSTDGASSIGPTRARLNAAVNPGGQTTTWYFQLGTSTSYGTTTSAQRTGTGTHTLNESIVVSGLTPGATYDFRVVASNASGTTFGGNQSFATLGPPAVQTQASQGVSTAGATLAGAVNPGGLSTSWYFEYGTSTAYGAKTASENIGSGTSALNVSAPLVGLSPGTTYHYRLVAVSSAGTSYGADVAFTTPPALTLRVGALEVVHGNTIALSGVISTGAIGVLVTVSAEPYGASSFSVVGTTISRTGGEYVFYAKPQIGTTYEASANGGTSGSVTIGVRPSVSLTTLERQRLKAHVSAGVQLIGRQVQLQRLDHGRWVTLERLHLDTRSNAIFDATVLPPGRSTIRVALSVNEAGPGLLAGFSRRLGYRRS